ncbi:MAG: FkbM family methyltransferase [Alphaproteobacteria bacterium]|nr:FkbM family methyltransferase [Alphaproteobacteria bacterium]MBV8410227.1 FkbM family methyltransferase [Alphaproteobacteria bacterium]
MSATAKAEETMAGFSAGGGMWHDVRRTLRSFCPQAVLNWREARFYGRYGEVELHLLEFLCRRDQDAIDVGANDGSYVHYLHRHARRVIAFEPMPTLARALRRKFPRGVIVESLALSDRTGTVSLCMPVVDGVVVTGCSTVSLAATATYPAHRAIEVPMDMLDNVYGGQVGFIKIDVEGHEQAVLDGAVETIRRCRPRLLVEVDERLSPGGLARAKAYFAKLDYSGYFVLKGRLEPIERFSIEEHQQIANLPDLTAPLAARQRFGRYLYNFIFLPPGEPSATLERMSQRLQQL